MMPNSEMSATYRPPGQGRGTPTLRPRTAEAPQALRTDGRRPDPPEDCGGIGGFELVVVASDAGHPDHVEALRTFREWYGDGVLEHFRPTPFDIDEINSALTEFGSGEGLPRTPDITGGQVRVSAALAASWAVCRPRLSDESCCDSWIESNSVSRSISTRTRPSRWCDKPAHFCTENLYSNSYEADLLHRGSCDPGESARVRYRRPR
ncbi:IS1096 element passenger TnpR family protein [Nocardia jiangxiensis]|uniref:Plasmid pRiA4b Orf3-like domain-containing protein n=1 Tax=Nocardia jiangxiensis TaxID=282685 RepID=A0ABW6S6C2_9NOCA